MPTTGDKKKMKNEDRKRMRVISQKYVRYSRGKLVKYTISQACNCSVVLTVVISVYRRMGKYATLLKYFFHDFTWCRLATDKDSRSKRRVFGHSPTLNPTIKTPVPQAFCIAFCIRAAPPYLSHVFCFRQDRQDAKPCDKWRGPHGDSLRPNNAKSIHS